MIRFNLFFTRISGFLFALIFLYSTVQSQEKEIIKNKMLQFVAPIFQTPLVSDSLIASLVSPDRLASDGRQMAADNIAKLGASSMRLEHQARINEQLVRMQVFEKSGFRTAGKQALLRSAGYQAKTLELASKADFLTQQLEYEKEMYRVNQGRRAARLKNRIENITANPVNAVNAASGINLNALLESMRSKLMRYGYAIQSDPKYADLLLNLTMQKSDFDRIQLMLDVEGKPVVFPSTEGSGNVGEPPFAMTHPTIQPLMKDFVARLEKLKDIEIASDSFYSGVLEVAELLDEIDRVSDEVLGSGQENARKGQKDFHVWRIAKDYRISLRGLVDRLQIEGSPKLLQSRSRYDPNVYGDGVLPFVTFVASNGCKIAPAKPGDEGVYAKLLSFVLQLQAILEE